MATNVAHDMGRVTPKKGKKAPIRVTPARVAPKGNKAPIKVAPVAKMKGPIRATPAPKKAPIQVQPMQAKMKPQARMQAPTYSGGQLDTGASGSYSGTTGSFGGGGMMGAMSEGGFDAGIPEVAPPPQKKLSDLTQEEKDAIYNSDTEFTSQQGALASARDSLFADLDLQGNEYNRGYTKNLSDIGWLGEGKGSNGWDQDNLQTAYGSSYHNDLNDFAGRGMLDSTAYLQAMSRMNGDFKNQVGELGSSKNAFEADLAGQRSTGTNTHNASLDEARRQALYRAAAANGWAV